MRNTGAASGAPPELSEAKAETGSRPTARTTLAKMEMNRLKDALLRLVMSSILTADKGVERQYESWIVPNVYITIVRLYYHCALCFAQ